MGICPVFSLSLILTHILWTDESDPPSQGCECVSSRPPLTHTRFPQDLITQQSSVKDKPLNYKEIPHLPPHIMDINLDFLKPLYELVQNEEVQKKLDETARLYWSPVS